MTVGTLELRERVMMRDKRKCHYCGRSCRAAKRKTPDAMTFDHKIPVCKGGRTALNNLVIACRWCNETKADAILTGRQLRELHEIANERGDVYARQLLLKFTFGKMRVRL